MLLLGDGIEKTSHQTRGALSSASGLWQSNHVVLSAGLIWHWTVLSVGVVVTYFGALWPFTVTCWFGSNTSTIWNGLTWMWNGWATGPGTFGGALAFSICHSSTVFSVTYLVSAGFS